MLLPDGKAAEAQGIHQGYGYTQRYCQELGRQPRFYNVRNPIPGSDWRNDGGWAIVLIRSAASRTSPRYSFSVNRVVESTLPIISVPEQGAEETLNIAVDGRQGFVRYQASGARHLVSGQWHVVMDLDRDGDIDNDDRIVNPYNAGQMAWVIRLSSFDSYHTEVYGGTYIRWANMLWCR